MSVVGYTLRPATDADQEVLFQLHCLTIREAVQVTWGWDEAFQAAYFRQKWDPTNRQIVLVDGRIAGMIQIEPYPTYHKLALIEIHPDYQNHGLGTALIQQTITFAHAQDMPLMLHVLKANPAAKRLYERLGFQLIEEQENRFVMQINPH